MAREKSGTGYDGGPTVQQKIMTLLEDGQAHSMEELTGCLWDKESEKALSVHLCAIKKILRPQGVDVVRVREGSMSYYRLVRRLASSVDGRK